MSHRCCCGPGLAAECPVWLEFGTSTAGTGNRERKEQPGRQERRCRGPGIWRGPVRARPGPGRAGAGQRGSLFMIAEGFRLLETFQGISRKTLRYPKTFREN